MSTRAGIGIQLEDGTIKAIYLHNDGYVSHAGAILAGYYNTDERIETLLNLGDLSSIGEFLEPDKKFPHTFFNRQACVVYAYHRDRRDDLRPARIYKNKEDYQTTGKSDFWADYLYLFANGEWQFFGPQSKDQWFNLRLEIEKQK